MNNQLAQITSLGIPTDTALAAALYVMNVEVAATPHDRPGFGIQTQEQYDQLITDIMELPEPLRSVNAKTARITFGYVVQEVVLQSTANTPLTLSEVWSVVLGKVATLVADCPWSVASYDSDSKELSHKAEKGISKRERARNIYNENKELEPKDVKELLMKELELSKGTATYYFYAIRREDATEG